MHYSDGSVVQIGDTVSVPTPDGEALARVVMLGDSREHLGLNPDFLEWVQSENALPSGSVIVEWLGNNPFAHADPTLSPVGNYIFTVVDEWVQLRTRAAA